MLLIDGPGTAEFAAKRDSQDANVAGCQAGQEILRGSGGRGIHAGREKYQGFLAGKVDEPIESGCEAGGEI